MRQSYMRRNYVIKSCRHKSYNLRSSHYFESHSFIPFYSFYYCLGLVGIRTSSVFVSHHSLSVWIVVRPSLSHLQHFNLIVTNPSPLCYALTMCMADSLVKEVCFSVWVGLWLALDNETLACIMCTEAWESLVHWGLLSCCTCHPENTMWTSPS